MSHADLMHRGRQVLGLPSSLVKPVLTARFLLALGLASSLDRGGDSP